MTSVRRAARFATLALAVYASFSLAWLAVGTYYTKGFCLVGTQLAAVLPLDQPVWFRALPETNRERADLIMILTRDPSGAVRRIPYSTRYFAYSATAFVSGLILATQIPWRQRGRALALGLGVVNLCLIVQVSAHLLAGFRREPFPAVPAIDLQRSALMGIAEAPWYLIPIMVWGAVVVRALVGDGDQRLPDEAAESAARAWYRAESSDPSGAAKANKRVFEVR